jgi:hypothetical protein
MEDLINAEILYRQAEELAEDMLPQIHDCLVDNGLEVSVQANAFLI